MRGGSARHMTAGVCGHVGQRTRVGASRRIDLTGALTCEESRLCVVNVPQMRRTMFSTRHVCELFLHWFLRRRNRLGKTKRMVVFILGYNSVWFVLQTYSDLGLKMMWWCNWYASLIMMVSGLLWIKGLLI